MDEIVVTASRRPLTAASSREINMQDYLLRPHSTTQEIMNNVPGLLVVQHQGGGKAFQYFLRGFDNDHGTDFLLLTDGMPVHLVSQAHGQGWADSNDLIPETVEGIRLFKGPYFADGTGFHSNDARAVVRTGRDGVVRALGGETGFRGTWVDGLDVASALWIVDLDEELVFSGDGGDVDVESDVSRRRAQEARSTVALGRGSRNPIADGFWKDAGVHSARPRLPRRRRAGTR